MLQTTCHYRDYDWSPLLQQPCCCRTSRKSSYCATFALLPPTVRPCTVLLQYTLPLHSLTVRPCHCIQYTLSPTCSTVVSPHMLLTALCCLDTVHAASVYFGLVLSTVHAACITHPVLRSSDSYPRLQTVTQQSLACLGTKTSIIASAIAFSHNLSLGAKLAQDGSPCHAPISKKLLHTFLYKLCCNHICNKLFL